MPLAVAAASSRRMFCRWASGGVALNCYRGRLQASRCLRATSIAPVALKVWRASRRRALARPARADEGRRGGNAHWPWPLSRPVLLPQSGGLARCGRGGTQESRRRVSLPHAQSDAQAGSRHAGQASQSQAKGLGSIRPDRRSRHQRYDLRGAAGPDPLMQKPGGDHREVGERPSRRAILNPSGNP